MGVLKIKDPNDPTGATWIDIMGTGVKGDPGGPVPVGGVPGEVIVKTGPADMEVGWAQHPRIAFRFLGTQVNSHATANTLTPLVTGSVTIDPDRWYQIIAGVRAIQDPGASICLAQFQVHVSVNLQGHDCVVTPDTGLWGSWSQTWVEPGSSLNAAGGPTVCELRGMISVAGPKIIYSPRLYILEF